MTSPMPSLPNDPAAACAILRQLANQRPEASTFEVAARGLAHCREGVQVCAAQTLARWRDHEAVPYLRRWLCELLTARHYSWAAATQAVRALVACIDNTDAPWMLDAYFDRRLSKRRRHLLPIVIAIEANVLGARILEELRSDESDIRLAALEIACQSQLPERSRLIASMQSDASYTVAQLARRYLASSENAG
jgi:hypothetical protein